MLSLLTMFLTWLGLIKGAAKKAPDVIHEVVGDIDKVDALAHKVEDAVDKMGAAPSALAPKQ